MIIEQVEADNSLESGSEPGSEPSGPFHCTECPRRFLTKSTRLKHLYDDHNRIKFECTICAKLYRGYFNVEIHLREIHAVTESDLPGMVTQARNMAQFSDGFKCPLCFKEYSRGLPANRQSALSRHVRQCHNMTFTQARKMVCSGLLTRSDPSSGPFKCTDCSKSFLSNYLRVRHMESEHDRVRFECPVCAQLYRGFYGAEAHLHKMHQVPRSEVRGMVQVAITQSGERVTLDVQYAPLTTDRDPTPSDEIVEVKVEAIEDRPIVQEEDRLVTPKALTPPEDPDSTESMEIVVKPEPGDVIL